MALGPDQAKPNPRFRVPLSMSQLIQSPFWPFAILFLGITAVVLMISVLRFHPFVALILSAIFVGLVSGELPAMANLPQLVRAVELPMQEFGYIAGKIAWVIALAAIIGAAMLASGAAERIVNWLILSLGEGKAALALLLSGFILSIPVFFDTVFFLLIPLAVALALKTGKNYLLYVITLGGGAGIAHSLVPPTPGPLIMAETLQLDVGLTILAGLGAGILPAIGVLAIGKWMNRRLDIPVRVPFTSSGDIQLAPSLALSILPILVPIALISIASVTLVVTGTLPAWMAFLGNKNVAMAVGTALALWLWARQKGLGLQSMGSAIGKPLEIAGVIILITSAGGAFGAMLKHSGIGDAIELVTEDFHVPYIILAWLIAAAMKTAQGSSTVSMITSSSIMFAIIGTGTSLPYHPMYILLAIGFGSFFISWMNDSGFWIVAKMSGFTEKETLQTWTVMFGILSLVGLVQVLLLSWVFPFR
jgi:GntP family gluconate:H+ symporter